MSSSGVSSSGEVQPGRRMPRGLAPLGYRNFGLYWLGQIGSSSGSQVETTATSWILYEITGSPVLLGLNGVFRSLPYFFVTPFAGVIVDRFNLRHVLYLTQVTALLNSVALGCLVAAGIVQPWHIYLEGFVQTLIAAVDVSARQTMYPQLVARRHLPPAINLNSTAARTATLVGPALGGLLLVWWGSAAPFFVNAASYLLLLLALGLMRHLPEIPVQVSSSVLADLAAGARYITHSSVILGVVSLEAIVNLLGHNAAVLTVFAHDALRVGPDGLGQLLSAVALGALAGNVTVLGLGDIRRKGLVLLMGGLMYAAAMLGFSFTALFLPSLVCLAVAGFANALFGIMRTTVIQLAAPPLMRGRIMAVFLAVSRGTYPLSQMQSGVTVALFGAGPAITVTAGLLGLSVLAVGAALPQLRQVSGLSGDRGAG